MHFTIFHNENGYHIHGKTIHYKGYSEPITPLYKTCLSYEACLEWLKENYPDFVIDDVQE